MPRHLPSLAYAVLALVPGVACRPAATDDQDELQALLRDADLTQLGPVARASGRAGPTAAVSDHSNLVLPSADPTGVWNFDDCIPLRSELADSSGKNHTAFRSVSVACADGIEGSAGVAIAASGDIVYVPDQPDFTFDSGVTVAGWFAPTTADRTQTLFRKRDQGTSSFALVLHRGKFRFVVNLGDAGAFSVTAPSPAALGAFHHVGATYDGAIARLYVDGVEVAHHSAAGTIPPGPGPLVMGNDGSERRFDGAIDSTLFATHALTATEMLALLCFPHLPTLAVTPDAIATISPDTPVAIDVAVTNHNPAVCAPITFALLGQVSDDHLRLDPPAFTVVHSDPVASGATGHIAVTATLADGLATDSHVSLVLRVSEPTTGLDDAHSFDLRVVEPAGCHVDTERELMIIANSVVDDPVRSTFDPSSSDPRNGAWTFKRLAENFAATPADAPAMVEAMFTSYTTAQLINGFTVAARPGLQTEFLNRWPRTAGGALDLAHAPLLLLAIVNRFDLRRPDHGDAGELRFVFGLLGRFDTPLFATLAVNYKVPAATAADIQSFANAFHALGAIEFGEDYNAALQAITDRVVARGARPDAVNGSALDVVQSDDAEFGALPVVPELREFRLSASSGRLEPSPIGLTPDAGFNGSATLASFITANEADILADRHTVPDSFAGQPFRAGAVFDNVVWNAPGIAAETRFHFAVNTCNGCHSQETGGSVFHLQPEIPTVPVDLSGYLTGETVADPVTGQPRTFGELARRRIDLTAAVCAP